MRDGGASFKLSDFLEEKVSLFMDQKATVGRKEVSTKDQTRLVESQIIIDSYHSVGDTRGMRAG